MLHRVGNAEPAMVRYRRPTDEEAAAGLDLVAIERALSDEYPPVELSRLEAHLAGRLIVDPDGELRAAEIARLVGVDSRTVRRWRAEHRTELTEGSTDMKTTIKRGERWHDRAACRGLGTDHFFPQGEIGTAAQVVYREAARICARCPVIEQCLRHALQAEGDTPAKSRAGVFGGLTPAQRHALHRDRVAAGGSEPTA